MLFYYCIRYFVNILLSLFSPNVMNVFKEKECLPNFLRRCYVKDVSVEVTSIRESREEEPLKMSAKVTTTQPMTSQTTAIYIFYLLLRHYLTCVFESLQL